MSLHKEVNKFQYDLLTNMIGQGNVVFAMLAPMESDTPDVIEKLNQDADNAKGLIAMGFLEDYSDKPAFKPMIEKALEEHKRPFKVFSMTPAALMCFTTVNGGGAVN